MAVEVFAGNTADAITVGSQIGKLREHFELSKVVLVGDRGMLTKARIREEVQPAGLDWIGALRGPAIRKLVGSGAVQLSLFDERDRVEVRSDAWPGERLVVCRNPLLAAERVRKREELLQPTEALLEPTVAGHAAGATPPEGRGQDRGTGGHRQVQKWPSPSSGRSTNRGFSTTGAMPGPSPQKPRLTGCTSSASAWWTASWMHRPRCAATSKHRSARPRRGNTTLREVLIECAQAAARTHHCQFRAYHKALTVRRGYKRANVATAHKLLRVIHCAQVQRPVPRPRNRLRGTGQTQCPAPDQDAEKTPH